MSRILDVYEKVRNGTPDAGLRLQVASLLRDFEAQLNQSPPMAFVQAHPLGFFAIRWPLGDGRELRLHVWARKFEWVQEPNWPIHDHTFSFGSTILAGSILNKTYDIERPAVEGDRSWGLYSVSYVGDTSIVTLEKSGVRLVARSAEVKNEGEHYLMHAGDLHRSRLLSEAAITVLATWSVNWECLARVIGDGRSLALSFQRSAVAQLNVPVLVKIVENFLLGNISSISSKIEKAF